MLVYVIIYVLVGLRELILDLLYNKRIKFLQVGMLGTGFRLRKNVFPLARNKNTKKLSLLVSFSQSY